MKPTFFYESSFGQPAFYEDEYFPGSSFGPAYYEDDLTARQPDEFGNPTSEPFDPWGFPETEGAENDQE